MTKRITLRIKKKYFDQILKGTKQIEFRDSTDFYKRLLRDRSEISELKLHYQKPRQLVCDVTRIELVSLKRARELSPKDFEGDVSDEVKTSRLFAIHLKRPRLIRSRCSGN